MNRPHWEYSLDDVLRLCDESSGCGHAGPVAGAAVKRLGVGVIGLGVGAQHAEVYARRADCELVTLCDLSPEKLAEVGPRFPAAKRTTDAATVLADPSIQIVSIATYDDCHHGQVIEALGNGKHVFVEKPLCLDRREFDDIKSALARSSGAHALLEPDPPQVAPVHRAEKADPRRASSGRSITSRGIISMAGFKRS